MEFNKCSSCDVLSGDRKGYCQECTTKRSNTAGDSEEGQKRAPPTLKQRGTDQLKLEKIATIYIRKEAESLSERSGYPLNPEDEIISESKSKMANRSHQRGSISTVVSPSTSASHFSGISAVDAETGLHDDRRRREREKALDRFRSKRANRSFTKTIRYECRKQIADNRPRVKGRFIGKGMEPCEQNKKE